MAERQAGKSATTPRRHTSNQEEPSHDVRPGKRTRRVAEDDDDDDDTIDIRPALTERRAPARGQQAPRMQQQIRQQATEQRQQQPAELQRRQPIQQQQPRPAEQQRQGGNRELDWASEIEKRSFMERRKLTVQFTKKEHQIAELEQHLAKGTCPKAIKATAQFAIPDDLEIQVKDELKKAIREFEVKVIRIQGRVLDQESETIVGKISSLLPRHLAQIEKLREELVQQGILPIGIAYDEDTFCRRCDQDERKTRFLAYQEAAKKQKKKQELAEKKAAENVEMALEGDAAIAVLKKDMEELKKAMAKNTGKENSSKSKDKKEAKKSGNGAKKQQKAEKKNEQPKKQSKKQPKNARGPGKQSGPRGSKKEKPAKGKRRGGENHRQ